MASDTSSGVRRQVCVGLVQMMQICPEKLMPRIKDIIEYMLHSTSVCLGIHFSPYFNFRTFGG
jgi:hypothetical protein